MLKNANIKAYRFSLSWTRLFPDAETFNPAGVTYYINLLDALDNAGITPMVTIYHWDTPQVLQDRFGGWISEEIVPYFLKFSEKAFDLFARRVKYWFTINEPLTVCQNGYDIGGHAPGRRNEGYRRR